MGEWESGRVGERERGGDFLWGDGNFAGYEFVSLQYTVNVDAW